LDDEAKDGKIIALQSLLNAQLIQILQHHDGNDHLTQMVEDEITRRKTDGAPPPTGDTFIISRPGTPSISHQQFLSACARGPHRLRFNIKKQGGIIFPPWHNTLNYPPS
jgi:hypothetical protein